VSVLYGCEIWSLILSKELISRVYENRVMNKAFEPKREEVKCDWGKPLRGELQVLYTLPYTHH
jgi:hypothetical protein